MTFIYMTFNVLQRIQQYYYLLPTRKGIDISCISVVVGGGEE